MDSSDATILSFLKDTEASQNPQIFPLAGDASSRRYFRVVSNEQSWVLMVWEPFVDDNQYPFLSVRNHFEKAGVQVPQVIAKSPNLGLVLLEDLGDLTLERKYWENQNQRLAIPYYKLAIDELLKIHYKATPMKNSSTAFKMSFDTEKLLWEMNYAREHLLKGLCQIKFSESEDKALTEVFHNVCQYLSDQDRYVCHRDYHSRNLMLKLGKMRVIDFQDARLGPIQYDLVSLLRDSYVNLDTEIADELIRYYLDGRVEMGERRLSLAEFYEVYEMQTIQRCFKACGSFASFLMLRQDKRYLKYLPPTLKTVRRTLAGRPECLAFLEILETHNVFERPYEKL